MPAGLKLVAKDADDLTVISACLQDAVARVIDLAWLKDERRFAILFNRFRWERSKRDLIGRERHERIISGLHFEHVVAVRYKGFSRRERGRVLSLLAVTVVERAERGFDVNLTFADNIGIRLQVDQLATYLGDRSPGWQAPVKPRHPIDDDAR